MISLLLSLHVVGTIFTIFSIVGFRLKRLAADRASLCGVITKNLRFQRQSLFIFQQNTPEEFAVDGIGNALNTDT